ncbi:MAG: arginine--tRNA ligase, partial [Eubacterium sp.]|nr:arginine--tRNA ligase [Eubacterium sp.]
LNFDGETGPYVQYTHARCCSLLRKAEAADVAKAADPASIDFSYLTGDAAYDLVKLLYAFPGVIEQAGERYEPSLVARHIVDIAQSFNRFYHDEHIICDNADERVAKLALVTAAKTAIKNGLALLGIHAPERM